MPSMKGNYIMQISNNFNRFSASQPQFGMALKIKKGAEKFLKNQSNETLQRLGKIGDDIADFRHFDLEVGEHGYAVKLQENAEYIRPKYMQEGPSFRDPKDPNAQGPFDCTDIDFEDGETKNFYKEFKNSDPLGKQEMVIKWLEDKYNKAFSNSDNVSNAINDLLMRFGFNDLEI